MPATARRKCQSGAPKRRPSSSAIGRAPIATTSRMIPPTPVAAPWNGSTARRMVVRLDLERDRDAVAEVDHAGVLARPLQDALALRRQPPQQQRRVLVAAVLRPEHREDGELEVVRRPAEQLPDVVELPVGESERPVQRLLVERLIRDGRQTASLAGRSDGEGGMDLRRRGPAADPIETPAQVEVRPVTSPSSTPPRPTPRTTNSASTA